MIKSIPLSLNFGFKIKHGFYFCVIRSQIVSLTLKSEKVSRFVEFDANFAPESPERPSSILQCQSGS